MRKTLLTCLTALLLTACSGGVQPVPYLASEQPATNVAGYLYEYPQQDVCVYFSDDEVFIFEGREIYFCENGRIVSGIRRTGDMSHSRFEWGNGWLVPHYLMFKGSLIQGILFDRTLNVITLRVQEVTGTIYPIFYIADIGYDEENVYTQYAEVCINPGVRPW